MSPVTPKKLWHAQDGRCFHCDGIMSPWSAEGHRDLGWTREHFIPKSRLKSSEVRPKFNIVLAHSKCNLLRGNTFPKPQEVDKFKSIYRELFNNIGV